MIDPTSHAGFADSSTAILNVRALRVRFGRRTALRDLDLTIADRRRVVGVFGQNGAGKSTLLRTFCGVINRFDGTITSLPPSVAHLPDAAFLLGTESLTNVALATTGQPQKLTAHAKKPPTPLQEFVTDPFNLMP